MKNKAKDFYDAFDSKLIEDYVTGLPRTEQAIQFAKSMLTRHDRKNIFDLGCGLGWSSHEFANHLTGATVIGVDLSTTLIENASRLFQHSNLSYQESDLTQDKWPFTNIYDAFVMLDVYEHIPKEARQQFHANIKNTISDDGIVVLTCPSVFHQNELRENRPEGLQPIDEDVNIADLETFANDIGGTLIHFEYVQIWKAYDYFNATIALNVSSDCTKFIEAGPITSEPKKSRLQRVERILPEEAYIRLKSRLPVRPSMKQNVKRKLKGIIRNPSS